MTTRNRAFNSSQISAKRPSLFARQRQGLLKSTAIVAVAFVASMALTPMETSAQQFWDGANTTSGDGVPVGGAGTWDAATANWTDDALGTNNQAWVPGGNGVFNNVGGVVELDAVQSIGNLTFSVDGYTLEDTGGAVGSLTIVGAPSIIEVTNIGQAATISALISGAGGLSKTGDGALSLTGANTYTGSTDISAGTLSVTGAGSLSGGGLVNLTGGDFQVDAGALGGGNVVQITNAASTFDVDGDVTIGVLTATMGFVDIAGGSTLTVNGLGAPGTSTVSSVIQGVGGGFTKGSGTGTIVLAGASTYTGSTNISAGILDVTGSIANSTTVNVTGGELRVAAAALAATAVVDVTGTGTFSNNGSNTIAALSSAATASINLAAGTLTTGNGANQTIAGTIIGVGNLTKVGAGILILANNNLAAGYSGVTTINAGVVSAGSTGALGGGNVFIATGATLNIADTVNVTNFVSVTGNANLDVSAGNTGTISGQLFDAGNLVKTGTGTLNLSGNNNTHTGDFIINAGALVLTGGNAMQDGATVSFNGAGTLDVNAAETIATLNVNLAGAVVDTVGGALTTTNTNLLLGQIQGGTLNATNRFDMTGGTVVAGTIINAGFFSQTGGAQNGTVNAGYAINALGGTITALGTFGIDATNNGAITLTAGASAPAIVSATNGINLDSTAAGDLTVTTGNSVDGGNNGILLSNAVGGNVSLTLGGNVGTTTGDAIRITNAGGGTVLVNGTGNVTAQGGVGSDGIQINSDGDTTVTVTGNIEGDPGIVISSGVGHILVNGVGSVVGALQAMNLDTTTGNITVTQDATIAPGIQGGTIGIDAQSTVSGNIDISGIGNITGQGGEGVLAATAGTGTISVNHNGAILGSTTGVNAATTGTGTVTVTSFAGQSITGTTAAGVTTRTTTGLNTVNGAGTIAGVTFGIDAQSLAAGGSVLVTGTGATTTTAANSTAIKAQSTVGNGNVTVTRTGTITNSGAGGFGIDTDATGTGNILITSGIINLTNAGATSSAIEANQNGAGASGTITVNSNGAINVAGSGGSHGIRTVNTTTGITDINVAQSITLAAASTGNGVQVLNINAGAVGVNTVDTAVGANINGGLVGIYSVISGVGSIAVSNVTVDGDIGNISAPTNAGVFSRTQFGSNIVQGSGNISGGAFGIDAQSVDGEGVQVLGAGTTTASGAASTTINARSGGIGTVVVNRTGLITNTGTGGTFGIFAQTTGTGDIAVTNTGGVTIAGAGSFGVSAGHGGGALANVVINGAGAVVSTGTGNSIGVAATNDSAGSINVTTGAVTMAAGSTGAGVFAQNSGTGSVTVLNNGAVVGGAVGINAASTTGAVAVTTGANVTGLSGSGITVASTTGVATITVGAGHTVTGATSAISSSAGTTTANIAGTLNSSGGAGSVFTVTAGTFALTNAGTAFGAIQSSAGTTTSFTNNSGATWTIANATSTLAGASDTIQNDGTMISTGIVNFTGVEVFNNTSLNTFTVNGTTTVGPNVVFTNTGRISMQDGAIDDRLNINGTFNGAGSSTLDVDIDVSKNNTGGIQLSDIMVVRGGPVTGATTVNFNVLAGTPTLQDAPIIIVDVDPGQANTGTFTDTNGTLAGVGGIIQYQLAKAANGDWVVNSILNTAAIGAVSGSIQSTLSVIGAVVNRPSSPFVASPIAPEPNTCAPGTWGRGTGGHAKFSNKSGIAGSGIRDKTTSNLAYYGFQGGVDFGCFNIKGTGIDVASGLTGGFNNGYSSTKLTSGLVTTSLTTSNFEARFGGGYVSFQKGSFFADIQGRMDYGDFKLNNPAVGLNNVKVSSERFSLTGTAGYSIELPASDDKSYNLLPAIGGTFARSKSDIVLFADGSTLKLKDQTDLLGFAGVTLNRVIVAGGEDGGDISAYIPFATVTMYNEFGDTPTSLFTDSAGTQRTIESQNLGLYGEFSTGVNYRKIFTSETSRIREISAGIRGDYKFGQRVQAVGVTAQIRFQF